MDISKYCTISEYAAAHGLADSSPIRHRIARGQFGAARKIGGVWLIPRDAPIEEHRGGNNRTGNRRSKTR